MDCQIDSAKIIEVPKFNYFDRELYCKLEDVFDSIFFVRLETQPNCIIGNVWQMEVVNENIFVCDLSTRGIRVFDMQGNYICKIGTTGHGPYEFVEPSDMHVTDTAVLVYDQWQHKLLKYNHRGIPIFEKILPFVCNQVAELNSGDYLYRGVNSSNHHLPKVINYQFWQTDTSFIVKNVGLYRKYDEFQPRLNNCDFIKNNSCIYYYDEITDYVYKFDSVGRIKPSHKFNFLSNHDKDIFLIKNPYKSTKAFNEGDYVSVLDIKFIGNGVLYTLLSKGICTFVFQNLRTNKVKYFKRTDFENSTMSKSVYMTQPLCVYNDFVGFSITPERILPIYNYIKSNNMSESSMSLFDKNLIDGLKEDDNPIIVFGRVKKEFYE